MSFFLLGRGPEGELFLLSDSTHSSRKAAMAHLSSLTSDPDFAYWDAEVLVMDADAGTPVLLMRPAAAATAEAAEEPTEVVVTAEEEVGDEAIADEIAAEAEELEAEAAEEEAEPEAVAETEDEAPSLKKALSRTARQMESEGITPPESIGPAEEAEDASQDEQETEQAGEEAEPVAETPGEAEPEAGGEAQWPWDAAAAEATAPEVVVVEEEFGDVVASEFVVIDEGAGVLTEKGSEMVTVSFVADEVEPAEVTEVLGGVEAGPEADAEFSLDDLEAPAAEASPLVAGVSDEDFDISKPVILDGEEESPGVTESMGMGETDEDAAAPVTEASSDDISAFILDLGSVSEIPEMAATEPAADLPAEIPAEEPAPEPLAPSKAALLPGVTCDDCVYETTCPNKDGRTPQQCGSFQWKSL